MDSPLWEGLESCRRVAESINDGGELFTWLPAAQLLKHALGLSKNQPQGFKLVLLWYRIEGHIAVALESEIQRFAKATSADLDFTALTYSELISRLVSLGVEPSPGYFEYLADRYQDPGEPSTSLPLITLASPNEVDHKTNLALTTAGFDPYRMAAEADAEDVGLLAATLGGLLAETSTLTPIEALAKPPEPRSSKYRRL